MYCLALNTKIDRFATALADLLCHSLLEDKYGLAQKELPRVLEAFVLYLGVLEQLVGELGQDESDAMQQTLHHEVQPLLTGSLALPYISADYANSLHSTKGWLLASAFRLCAVSGRIHFPNGDCCQVAAFLQLCISNLGRPRCRDPPPKAASLEGLA